MAGIIFIIFLSSIVKYVIEKYSEEYTGREITMENLHINLLTGNIRVDKLKIYEAKSRDIFFACDKIETGISVHKLLASKYDITELKIEKPLINITQKGNCFNYGQPGQPKIQMGQSDLAGDKKYYGESCHCTISFFCKCIWR